MKMKTQHINIGEGGGREAQKGEMTKGHALPGL